MILIGDCHRFINKSEFVKHLLTECKGYGQSIFGLHLLCESIRPVVIVESEKTALIASLNYPQYIWLASGGANGLTEAKLKPIQNRRVILIPDCDVAGRKGFKNGLERLKRNGNQVTFKDLFPNLNDGSDLADFILNKNFNF